MAVDLDTRARLLAELRGTTAEIEQRRIEKSPTVDYAGINTVVVDIKGGEPINMPGLDVPEGVLTWSGETDLERYGLNEAHLEHADLGGQGNILPNVSRLGISAGAVAHIGDDLFSRFFVQNVTSLGVDTSGLIDSGIPIGIAVAVAKSVGERAGIAYFPRSNLNFDGTPAVLEALIRLNPVLGHNSYIGLSHFGWDRGSRGEGEHAEQFLRWQQEQLKMRTTTDTHSYATPDEVKEGKGKPEFMLLKGPLRFTNNFICSLLEAKGIMNTFGWSYDKGGSPESIAGEFLQHLESNYFKGNDGQPRIFGVSMRERVIVSYRDNSGKVTHAIEIKSPYSSIPGVDVIGAGDALKAGLGVYEVLNQEAFGAPNFNVTEALTAAQLVATLYVAAPAGSRCVQRFVNIRPYADLMPAIKKGTSGHNYTTMQELLKDTQPAS